MLKSLVLTNYRKHEHLKVDFTEGLNLIRADNEAGKSTLLEALGYAYWGARALPESLEATVTWGRKPSTLKVEHEFSVHGLDYSVTRSKSGAELRGPDNLVVVGHAEVTTYCEKLLGASAKIGLATFFAAQSSLKESLDNGAISLIEKLADMDLLDRSISRIQEVEPNGNTKVLESHLAGLANLTAPIADFDPLTAALVETQDAVRAQQEAVAQAESRVTAARIEAGKARARIQDAQASQTRFRSAQERVAKLGTPVEPAAPAAEPYTLEQIDKKIQEANDEDERRAAYERYRMLPHPEYKNYTRAEAEANMHEAIAKRDARSKETIEIGNQLAGLRAMKITQTVCGLCDKDLSNIPEVVRKNADLDAQIAQLETRLAVLKEEIGNIRLEIHSRSFDFDIDDTMRRAHAAMSKYTKLDDMFPCHIIWTAADIDSGETPSYWMQMRAAMLKRESTYNLARQNYEMQVKQLDNARAELASVECREVDPADIATVEAVAAIEASWSLAQAELAKHQRAEHVAASALNTAQVQHASAMQNYERLLASKAQLEKDLASYALFNGIIKKLREARPIVARELWVAIAASISDVFSQIRGEVSTVVRDDDRFTINGVGYKSFSGSTQDALGLALRIATQKTFLTDIDFMIVDEPAAAADATREVEMIAALVRADLKQIVMVSHSALAEPFATSIITL